jgi:hypothetical protein
VYLIALSGGTTAERSEIAERLVVAGKGRLTLCAQAELKPGSGVKRDRQLAGRQAAARAHLLSESLKGLENPRMQGRGYIVAHCVTAEEAAVVRECQGAIWHVYSRPCSRVAIQRGDPIVTATDGSFAHVREPVEALSEYLLTVGRTQRHGAR